MIVLNPVQSSDPWRQSRGYQKSIKVWEGFVEEVGFEPGV